MPTLSECSSICFVSQNQEQRELAILEKVQKDVKKLKLPVVASVAERGIQYVYEFGKCDGNTAAALEGIIIAIAAYHKLVYGVVDKPSESR